MENKPDLIPVNNQNNQNIQPSGGSANSSNSLKRLRMVLLGLGVLILVIGSYAAYSSFFAGEDDGQGEKEATENAGEFDAYNVSYDESGNLDGNPEADSSALQGFLKKSDGQTAPSKLKDVGQPFSEGVSGETVENGTEGDGSNFSQPIVYDPAYDPLSGRNQPINQGGDSPALPVGTVTPAGGYENTIDSSNDDVGKVFRGSGSGGTSTGQGDGSSGGNSGGQTSNSPGGSSDPEPIIYENCTDGIDNNANGYADCKDTGCLHLEDCIQEMMVDICNNTNGVFDRYVRDFFEEELVGEYQIENGPSEVINTSYTIIDQRNLRFRVLPVFGSGDTTRENDSMQLIYYPPENYEGPDYYSYSRLNEQTGATEWFVGCIEVDTTN